MNPNFDLPLEPEAPKKKTTPSWLWLLFWLSCVVAVLAF